MYIHTNIKMHITIYIKIYIKKHHKTQQPSSQETPQGKQPLNALEVFKSRPKQRLLL